MTYPSVIKFLRTPLDGEAFLASLGTDFSQALGNAATLNGHDVSAKEINPFMHIDNPRPRLSAGQGRAGATRGAAQRLGGPPAGGRCPVHRGVASAHGAHVHPAMSEHARRCGGVSAMHAAAGPAA